MIKPFTLGSIGSLISAVFVGIVFIMNLFPIVNTYDMNLYDSFYFYKVFIYFFWLLLGVGIVLASFGYRDLRKKYNLLFGTVGFAFGVVASVSIFFAAAVRLITLDYMILIYPPTLIHSINFWASLLNLIFFGLTHIVWGIAHLKSKKFCKKPNLSLATSGFFIASGVVLLSTFSSEIGLGLSFASLLSASIVFLDLRSDI